MSSKPIPLDPRISAYLENNKYDLLSPLLFLPPIAYLNLLFTYLPTILSLLYLISCHKNETNMYIYTNLSHPPKENGPPRPHTSLQSPSQQCKKKKERGKMGR